MRKEESVDEILAKNEILMNANLDLVNFLNNTKIATIFLDHNLNLRGFTPAVSELYDLRQEDLGKSINAFKSKALKMPQFTSPKDLGQDEVIETEVLMPDGRIFLRRKSAYMDRSQQQVGLVVTFVDVTDLRHSESTFKTLANTVPQMIWMTDSDGNYIYFSSQWKNFSGLDPLEVENMGFRDIVHPDDLPGAMIAWNRAQKSADLFEYQYRLRDKNGVYHWHLVKAQALRDGTDRVYRWCGSCTNIQSQKELELSLKDSETRYSMASKATRELIWDWNLIDDSVLWNDALSREIGYPEEDQKSDADWWIDHIHPDDRQRVVDGIHQTIEDKINFWNDEYRFLKADGNYGEFADHGYILIENGEPIRMIGSMLDITERNDYLKQMHEAVNARDEFLSIASHELKTPITSMMLKIQLMQRQMQKGELQKGAVEKTNELVLKQCRLLTSLIEDMLDVSRIATGRMKYNPEMIDLNSVVSHAIDVFSGNFHEREVKLTQSLEENLIVEGDPYRLEQVIYNLLSNALKYGLGKPISIELKREGKDAVIKVKDNGIGIPERDQSRVFARFERAVSSKISGLGLGLYISKEIIDAHSGKISVESKIGEGSVFSVSLSLYN